MKKGKVEWLYKVAALMDNGKVGIDFITVPKKWTHMDVQELAEAMKTNVHIEYMGTIIKPPESKKEDKYIMTYDYLTEEEKETRLAYAQKQYEKEQKDNANSSETTV